jgi:hypothetical protein
MQTLGEQHHGIKDQLLEHFLYDLSELYVQAIKEGRTADSVNADYRGVLREASWCNRLITTLLAVFKVSFTGWYSRT